LLVRGPVRSTVRLSLRAVATHASVTVSLVVWSTLLRNRLALIWIHRLSGITARFLVRRKLRIVMGMLVISTHRRLLLLLGWRLLERLRIGRWIIRHVWRGARWLV
jgi:hypothetical protein